MKQGEPLTPMPGQGEGAGFWHALDRRMFAWVGGGHQARPLRLRAACVVAHWSWLPLLAVMASVMLQDARTGLLTLAECLVLAGLVQWVGKRLARHWGTRRPFTLGLSPNHLNHSDRGGFPSAHAIVMGTVLGFMAPHLPGGAAMVVMMGLIVLATGWARVYAGAHFPLDVIVGTVTGIAVGGLASLAKGM